MAILGRWTGATVSILPSTAWAAPASLFPTQARNDTSAYSFASTTSTLTLPSSGLADGYLFIGRYEFEDASSGRCNPQGKVVQASGTGTFIGSPTGGYNRDASEDRSYISCWAFVDGPSASSTYQFQWKRDVDVPTGGTVRSSFDVIPLYYSNIGMYASASALLYGGTTPNQVTGFTSSLESDTAAIEIVSNVVTLKGDNKRYISFGSQFFEGRGGRTQRWHGFRVDGTKEDAAKGYSYDRNTSNDETGEMFTHLIERATTNITIDQFCYRGDGVTAGLGGGDTDGSTPNVGDHGLVVIELNDSAEVFHSVDGTGGIDLNVLGPVDQPLTRLADITVNDAASFTRSTDTGMNAEQAMDALLGANISAAQEVVGTTSRWTSQAQITVNGVEDANIFGGDYCRNNQGTTDTFGWSGNVLGYVALALNDDIGVSVQELSGGEDGGQLEVQPGWSGFWGLNLDTLEAAAGNDPILGTTDITFTPTGAIQGVGQLAGSSDLTFTATGGLVGTGGVSGATNLTFTESASLSALGALSGSSSIDFTPVGDLLGLGDLSGATTLTFTVDGDLQDAAGGFISGSSDITFTTSGALAGSGALTGSTSLDFVVSGSVQGKLFALGSAGLTFTTSGDLQATGRLSGSSGITFSETAAISARGALSGSSDLTFTSTGAAQDANSDSIAGNTGISFVATGNLHGYGLIRGSTTLTFTASARHEEEITDLGGFSDSGSTDDEDLLLIIREFLRVAA